MRSNSLWPGFAVMVLVISSLFVIAVTSYSKLGGFSTHPNGSLDFLVNRSVSLYLHRNLE